MPLWCLTVSSKKPKVLMAIGGHTVTTPFPVSQSESIDFVHDFSYLGSIIFNSGSISNELLAHLGKVSLIFGCLLALIFTK